MSMIRHLLVAAVLFFVIPAAYAQYRGYPGPGDVVRCESIKSRTAECPADTRYGLMLARQLSDSACIQGQTWGIGRVGVWVSGGCRADFIMGRYGDGYGDRYGNDHGGHSRFVCESRNGQQNFCSANGFGRIRLVRQISDSRCDEGRTWGQDRRGVWVSGGCRAEFVTTGYGGGWNDRYGDRDEEGGYDGGYGRSFRCESRDGRENFCNVDTRYGVRLVRRLSDSACIEGRSWGVARGGVWVSQGCRADFATGR